MKHKLNTEEGRKRYGLRKSTVESVFGIIKQATGLRQFLRRGLTKVQGGGSAGLWGVFGESLLVEALHVGLFTFDQSLREIVLDTVIH